MAINLETMAVNLGYTQCLSHGVFTFLYTVVLLISLSDQEHLPGLQEYQPAPGISAYQE